MKKAVLIILSVIVILSVFSVTALAAPADSMLLRAGGAIGGGGGGGISSFRRHRTSEAARSLSDMTGNEMLGALLFYLIYFAYILIMVLAAILIPIIVKKRKKKSREETRRLMAEYDDFDGFWSYEFVQNRIEEIYYGVQNAWNDGNMRKAEDLLTPTLYKRYQKHLDGMHRDGEKNVMKNIKLISALPVYAKDFTNNEHDYIWAKIEGSMADYVINEDELIVEGENKEQPFTEYWRFTRRRDGMWVLAEILQQYEFEKTRYYKGLSKL